MIQLSISACLIVFVVGLCLSQKRLERQHAAYVYAFGCAAHFLGFEYMKLKGIGYPWALDYIVAGFISLAIIIQLQNMTEYTKFHKRLQWIALCSIAVNGFGVMVQYLNLELMYYQGMAFTLYLILIGELLKDGRYIRLSRNTGVFRYLRWPAI